MLDMTSMYLCLENHLLKFHQYLLKLRLTWAVGLFTGVTRKQKLDIMRYSDVLILLYPQLNKSSMVLQCESM